MLKTLYQYCLELVKDNTISIELAQTLMDFSLGGKKLKIHIENNSYGVAGGYMEEKNSHGENQHRLDIIAHEIFLNILKGSGLCRYLISEECEQRIELSIDTNQQLFDVFIDPLDGTSNVDANVSVGTIFSIFNGSDTNKISTLKGRTQLAAGYLIYGTTTMLVLTFGKGVCGFTFDKNLGEFLLTHEKIKICKSGSSYSINEGNWGNFPSQIRNYLNFCKQSDEDCQLPYKSRYIGSMVADIHRILMFGGIFMYPSTSLYPKGKLRLMYECNPMAFLIEQAGGLAIDGMVPILDVIPREYHQKIPFIAGSYNMVKKVLNLYKNESINNHVFYSC